jgi:hypothetical protein
MEWAYAAGLILERAPVITRDNFDWEQAYFGERWAVSGERDDSDAASDLKDSFEWYDSIEIEMVKGPPTPEQRAKLLSMSEEEKDEARGYKLAPRITEADKLNDTKSLERALDQVDSLRWLSVER